MDEFCAHTPGIDDLVAALCSGFAAEFAILPERDELTRDERTAASALEARYADPEWTWRR